MPKSHSRILTGLLGLLLLAGCAATPAQSPAPPPAPPPEAPKAPPPSYARIVAVGDLLMHLPLVDAAALPGGQWDFKPMFEPTRPWIEGADLAVAELETTLTGRKYPWSGYPSFNTPPELARDIKAAGFDAVTNANNHALDYGEYGLKQTSDALDQAGLPHTGTNRTPAEQDQILVLNVTPTIKMALLAYTYGTNGIPLPQPWMVNLLDPDRIAADIRRARQLPDVDLVAVALHFGDEDSRTPNAQQEQLVKLSLDAGADLIFGDHVHVVQKIELRRVIDQFGRARPRAVIFSFGNFVGNQVPLDHNSGVIFVVDVKKAGGVTTVERVGFVPTWVHTYMKDGVKRFRTVAVEQAMRDYENKTDPLLTAEDYAKLKAVWADTTVQAVGSSDVVLIHADQPKSAHAGN